MLQWIADRYDIEDRMRLVKGEALSLFKAKTVTDVRAVEGRVALRYWQAIQSILPEWCDFQGAYDWKP